MGVFSWLIVIPPMAFIVGTAIYSRRDVISVGDLTAALSVIILVAMCEQTYRTGMAVGFSETRCLSCGQFPEMRYSRTMAKMVTNAIEPPAPPTVPRKPRNHWVLQRFSFPRAACLPLLRTTLNLEPVTAGPSY